MISEFVWWQNQRINIIGVNNVGKTNSYPKRNRHVMLVDVNGNYWGFISVDGKRSI